MNINSELVNRFNKLNFKKVISIKDMTPTEEYHITGAERTTTKYGEVILLELETNVLYLPKRFNSLTDREVEYLSSGAYIISKISVTNESDNSPYRLELKTVPPMKDYYNYTFK